MGCELRLLSNEDAGSSCVFKSNRLSPLNTKGSYSATAGIQVNYLTGSSAPHCCRSMYVLFLFCGAVRPSQLFSE